MGMMTEYYHYIFTTLVSTLLKHKNNAMYFIVMTLKWWKMWFWVRRSNIMNNTFLVCIILIQPERNHTIALITLGRNLMILKLCYFSYQWKLCVCLCGSRDFNGIVDFKISFPTKISVLGHHNVLCYYFFSCLFVCWLDLDVFLK